MTRQHVHLRPSGNGSLVFKNDFIINCIYIIHTNTHTHTLLIQSDPAYVFAPPIYGPQLHDVMAALKIKTNTDRLPASAFLKLTPSHTAIEKKEHTHTHTHTDSGTHMSWVEADVNLVKLQESYRGLSTGTAFVRWKMDWVTLSRLKNSGCTSVFSKRKQHDSCFSRLMKFKNSCVSVYRPKNHFIKPQSTWLIKRSTAGSDLLLSLRALSSTSSNAWFMRLHIQEDRMWTDEWESRLEDVQTVEESLRLD